jgi:hydroxypyruvate reductase 1
VQDWGAELFEALKQAGGHAYSNYAVGYNNVKVPEATKRGIPVGNTPGAKQGLLQGTGSLGKNRRG